MPRKKTKKRKKRTQKKRRKSESSHEKYERGGRVEAYTMGEALGSKKWP